MLLRGPLRVSCPVVRGPSATEEVEEEEEEDEEGAHRASVGYI